MKYDAQLSELQRILPGAKNVLVALSAQPTIDDLAAGLALFLSLTSTGKNVYIVSEGVIRVGHTNLFGVGQIQNKMPKTDGGNLIISLGGVVTNGEVSALEKLDWYPEGSDLNLVFHVIPGQKFEPTHVTPRFEGGSFDLIFTIGGVNLSVLGSVYTGHEEMFKNVPVANFDNKVENTGFGTTNVIDPNSSSLSEIIVQVLTPLQLPFEGDVASNLLAGIFVATNNLQTANTTADTFASVALAMQMGGQRPQVTTQPTPEATNFAQAFMSDNTQPQPDISNSGFNLNQSVPGQNQPVNVPLVVSQLQQSQSASGPTQPEAESQPSPEEQPVGEEVITPESDWLTPKIFKGSSIG